MMDFAFPYAFPIIFILMYIAIPVLVIVGFLKLYHTYQASVKARQEQNEILRELVAHLKAKNDIK